MRILNHSLLFLLCFCTAVITNAQEKQVQGIVFDKETQQRVGKVFIKNVQTKANTYNNARGEFTLPVSLGDQLICTKDEYIADTITYTGQPVFMVYLTRKSIYIPQVNVAARRSPDALLQQRKDEFNKAYKLADPGSVFSVGPTGAGLSIGSIFNMLSREGKNARRLTRFIQKEYEADVIDTKFSRDLVHLTTGLEGDQLSVFMSNYRPSYAFVSRATPYELTRYIRSKYEIFKLNPNLRFLPQLPEIDLEVHK